MTDWSLEESMATQPNLAIVDDVYGEAADLYVNILGVPPDADLGTIQLAFLDRRQEFFQAMSEAANEELRETLEHKLDAVVMTYRILGDEELRLQYDELRPSRLALQEMMIREMRRKKKKKKASSSSSNHEKASAPTATTEPSEETPVPVTPPANQSPSRRHQQQHPTQASPSEWEEPFDVKHNKEIAPPSPEARPRSRRAHTIMAESRNADNSSEYPVPVTTASTESRGTRVSIEQGLSGTRSGIESPTTELALQASGSSESRSTKKSSQSAARHPRVPDDFKENVARTKNNAAVLPASRKAVEPIQSRGPVGYEHIVNKAASADAALPAAKVSESRTDRTTVPAARSYESRTSKASAPFAVSSELKVRKAAIPIDVPTTASSESRSSKASIPRARSAESKSSVPGAKSSQAKTPKAPEDVHLRVSPSRSQENSDKKDSTKETARTPESASTKASSTESRSSRAAVEAQVRAKYGRSRALKKEESNGLWSSILAAVSSDTQQSVDEDDHDDDQKIEEPESTQSAFPTESEPRRPAIVSPEPRNHPWIEPEVHSRSMLLSGNVVSRESARAIGDAAKSPIKPESREPETRARRHRPKEFAPEVNPPAAATSESKRRRSPPNPDGHYKFRSSDLNENTAAKSLSRSHNSSGRTSSRLDPPEADSFDHEDPPTLQISSVIIPPIDSETEEVGTPPRREHVQQPILRPPPALKSSLSPRSKSVFDNYHIGYGGEVSFEKRPIVTFDCPPDKDPSDDHTDETIMTDDEARTVDDYFDDNMTINSQGTLVCRAEQGFFKRVKDDFYDAIEDTGRTFEQVINAFTLNEEDIKAVQMRIERARFEMNMGVNVD